MPTVAEIKKTKLIEEYRRGKTDTGSPEVQVAILTNRVTELTDHLRANRHDHASRRGLLMMVGRRNRLLRYLSRTSPDSYRNLIKRLGLRK
jgi:small subunit ribosomal protein S15